MQIIDGEWYIAGETHNFLTIHLRTKQVLADFAARYKGRLPDVDFVLQTSDWLPPSFNGTCTWLIAFRESCSYACMMPQRLLAFGQNLS